MNGLSDSDILIYTLEVLYYYMLLYVKIHWVIILPVGLLLIRLQWYPIWQNVSYTSLWTILFWMVMFKVQTPKEKWHRFFKSNSTDKRKHEAFVFLHDGYLTSIILYGSIDLFLNFIFSLQLKSTSVFILTTFSLQLSLQLGGFHNKSRSYSLQKSFFVQQGETITESYNWSKSRD